MSELARSWHRGGPEVADRDLHGTLVFADISGFTRLTERLAARGRIGAEEMSDHLDLVLSELLNAAYGYGGWLVKWGGDALLVMFDGADHAERACAASAAMRSRISEVGLLETSVGRVRLRMSIGVHTGDFSFHLVGSQHRELLITGDAATITARLEADAVAGQILISPSTAEQLPPRCVGAAVADGYLLARPPSAARSESGAGDDGDVAHSESAAVWGLLPELVRGHLIDGGGVGEHRQVTVAFLEFSGMAELGKTGGVAAANAALRHLVVVAQEACHRHHVSFHETDISPDGGKLMLVAGAPQGLEEPSEAMLCALRQIFDDPGRLSVRAGVTAGRAFTGCVGPSRRRSYSVKGDVVNLAARIMGKTPVGQIWALPVVVETSRTQFQLDDVPRFSVKGKSAQVTVKAVGRALARVDSHPDLPIIGRSEELARLTGALDRARAGRGSHFDVVGSTGIGKTRLLVELVGEASDMTVLTAAAEPYRTSSPYSLVRSLFLDGLVQDATSATGQAASLAQWCEAYAPQQLPWLPLLAPLLGVSLPHTPQTRELARKFRPERTRALILDLLRIRIPGPSLLIVDNLQFADEASIELLRLIVANVAGLPWLVVLSQRADHDSGLSFAAGSGRPEESDEIALAPLSEEESLILVHAETDDAPLAPHVASVVVDRGDGNPLFLRLLARAAQTMSDESDLPDSIESVVSARIDRLRPAAREVLRAAAVVGMKVDRDLLGDLLAGDAVDPASVFGELGDFVQPIGSELRFRQVAIRDAAYAGLAFRRRSALHGRLARLLVDRYGDERDDLGAVLSLHYFHAGDFDKALATATVAGDRAAAAYTNQEAALLYSRALAAAARAPEPDVVVRADLLEHLGDVQVRLGEYEPADRCYAAARRLLRGDPLAVARLGLKSARGASQRGAYGLTLSRLRRIAITLDGVAGTEADDLRVEVRMRSAWTQVRQGRLAAARKSCLAVLGAVDETRDPAVAADALGILDIVDLELGLGDGDADGRATHALRLHEQTEDLGGQARVHNMIGYRSFFEGRWDDAVVAYTEAARLYRRLGDLSNAAVNDANLAEILIDQGRLEAAETALSGALRIWRAGGADNYVAFGLALMGRVQARQGRYDAADAVLEQARGQFVEQGAKAEVVDADTYRAESLLLRGRPEQARALAQETLAAAARLSAQPTQAPMLHRILGGAHDALGDPAAASAAYDQALQISRQRNADHEVAFTISDMMARATRTGTVVAPDLLALLTVLQHQLGIVETAVPAPAIEVSGVTVTTVVLPADDVPAPRPVPTIERPGVPVGESPPRPV